ncbi:metal-sensitive transcriptional regulator [Streptomyces sp. NPDC001743]|uniref:metal-sensitive transcriptional regulator n=1 Tax=Streptomyces sp. NPDC001743 TaxID=3154397 RepID=UPI00332B723A
MELGTAADELKSVLPRLRRAPGQLTGIRMIEEGRECEGVVTQMAAVSRALDREGAAIIATARRPRVADGGGEPADRDRRRARLEKLFLSPA